MPNVSAHASLGAGDNESLATATLVPDPTKSWVIYAELHEGGEAQYYRFDISAGQRIDVMLLKPTSPEYADFMPGFVLIGPGIENRSAAPGFIEVPPNTGVMVVNGSQPSGATYEAFAPSAFYQLAEVGMDALASGTYYVAVFEANRGGHYGLAIGSRESFTLAEWLMTPFTLLSVYQWEGQSLVVVLLPLVAAVAVGMGMLWRRQRMGIRMVAISWTASLAGLFFIGGGLTSFTQMLFALTQAPMDGTVGVTLMFAIIPIILGTGTLRLAPRHNGRWALKPRVYLVVIGMIALLLWAGYLIGPILAFVAAGMPARMAVTTGRETQA